jgi:uncharacterized DUF497 family protein
MFEWNEKKRAQNFNKHGVDFLDAALIFEGPILVRQDTRADYGETRFIALGRVDDIVYVLNR